MKLLFDQNISFRIIGKINFEFPDSKHISDVGLAGSDDSEIWHFARKEGFAIVTFDSDFYEMALILGCPPKVIWLRTGNLTTNQVAELLLMNCNAIKDFLFCPDLDDKACFVIE
jgi:predicted nuclease of predicted toxin-antitoxin system